MPKVNSVAIKIEQKRAIGMAKRRGMLKAWMRRVRLLRAIAITTAVKNSSSNGLMIHSM